MRCCKSKCDILSPEFEGQAKLIELNFFIRKMLYVRFEHNLPRYWSLLNLGKNLACVNRTITRLLEGILFICGPSSIICARAERGCK